MSRIQTVDVFRVLAILAVIALHLARHEGPGAVGTAFDPATFMNLVERFAVPMFFILSGYFWAEKCRARHDYLRCSLATGKRVLLLFAAWSLIYFLVSQFDVIRTHGLPGALSLWMEQLAHRRGGWGTLLLQGAKVHLWFLPALALAALASGALLARQLVRTLFVLALVLYAVGLAGKAYADSPLGFHTGFNLRNGPFFSLLMFASGWWLQQRGPSASWAWRGLLLALAGLLLQSCEVLWLHRAYGTNMAQDFVLGTWPYGLGMSMLALSDPKPARIAQLAALGPLVLGVYACHYLFVDGVQRHGVDGILGVALVFALSVALSWTLSRLPGMRRIVT